jgi:hypothetical protein
MRLTLIALAEIFGGIGVDPSPGEVENWLWMLMS